MPHDEYDQPGNVPDMGNGDGPRRAPEEIRREADEEDIEDAQGGRDGAQLVDPAGRISVQAFQPQQVAPG